MEPLDAVAFEAAPDAKPAKAKASAPDSKPAKVASLETEPARTAAPEPQPQAAARAAVPEKPRQPQTLAAAAVAVSRDMDQPGPFHVQVGAFPNQEQARERLESVKQALGQATMKAHPEFIMTVALPTGVTMFRARLSRFTNEAQAKAACKQLKRSNIECWDIRAQ